MHANSIEIVGFRRTYVTRPMTHSLARVGRVVRLHELGAPFKIYTGEASPFRVEVAKRICRVA